VGTQATPRRAKSRQGETAWTAQRLVKGVRARWAQLFEMSARSRRAGSEQVPRLHHTRGLRWFAKKAPQKKKKTTDGVDADAIECLSTGCGLAHAVSLASRWAWPVCRRALPNYSATTPWGDCRPDPAPFWPTTSVRRSTAQAAPSIGSGNSSAGARDRPPERAEPS